MTQLNIQRSLEYQRALKKTLPGGVHYGFRMPWESKPIALVRGAGTRVWDLDGNEYLDFFAKFGANILGHNHPEYNEVLIQTLQRVAAVNLGDIDQEVTETICSHIDSAEMVRFSLSGTEAVQNALRLARGYTKRNRFVRFEGHYHGNADNTLGGRVGNPMQPVPEEFPGDLYGTEGRATGALQDQSFLLPWNDLDVLEQLLRARHAEIAAVLMEPICINGGGLLPQPGYLQGVRRLCDEFGIILIFDEVITGFRVGLGGAQRELGVRPDLTTLGKAIAGGALPVSAIAGQRKLMKLYEDRKVVHGGTFNGYLLGLAAVKATLQILGHNGGDAYTRMNTHMTRIQEIFQREAARNDIELKIGGLPSCAVFNPAGDSSRVPMLAQYLPKLIGEALTEHGILVSNANRFYGNIGINEADIELFEQRIGAVFRQVGEFTARMRPKSSAAAPQSTQPAATGS